MTIWVDPSRGISLKQSFYMPSGDYRTAVYTDIKYDQKVDEKPYQIKNRQQNHRRPTLKTNRADLKQNVSFASILNGCFGKVVFW